jgi:hypothetical protein
LIARGREFTYRQKTNRVNGKLVNICVAHDCDCSLYLINFLKVVVVVVVIVEEGSVGDGGGHTVRSQIRWANWRK